MSNAQLSFEAENNVQSVNTDDALFSYDATEQKALQNAAPWRKDPHFFKKVRISAIALIKMVMHARSGGSIEVMGLMQGKVTNDGEILVMDSFALPVEGTETRVNAGAEAYEYMIQYGESAKKVSRPENVVGWYHSHPGYGCWLSGIDVGTQRQNQRYQDPFLAVVIDPNRTISAGAVDIGAFRTYPEDYTPPDSGASAYQNIPLSKIEDFGVHAKAYYPLQISHFKSSLDTKLLEALWNKYWASTLSQSPLVINRAYTTERMLDLTQKIDKLSKNQRTNSSFGAGVITTAQAVDSAPSQNTRAKVNTNRKSTEPAQVSELELVTRDMAQIRSEQMHGLITQMLKKKLFNQPLSNTASAKVDEPMIML